MRSFGLGNAANMSSYENAVYAAATSFLQSKASGQSNAWMNKKSRTSFNSIDLTF